MNTLNYEGYIAYIQYSEEDEEFFGTVVNTSGDEIVFGGKTVAELKKNMRTSVEGHITNCKKLGIQPKKSYSGRITYRTTPEQHAKLVQATLVSDKPSLNAWVDETLQRESEKILQKS